MKKAMLLFFIFIAGLTSAPAFSQVQLESSRPCEEDFLPEELQFLMAGTLPVVSEVNQCQEKYGLPKDYVKTLDEQSVGWPEALYENPMLCLESLFEGMKNSVEDILGAIWDLTKAFSKVVSGTFWGTYDFLKAAFTGNLSYWFIEASQNTSDFLSSFLDSIKAIPSAVVDFVDGQSEDWDCRNDKGQVEMACRLSGYLGTDVLAGVMTLGWSKLSLASKVQRLGKKITGKNNDKKQPKKKEQGLGQKRGGKLDELIPLSKRDSRFVVEVDEKGHLSVRYFDKQGNPKYFDGSPFYHLVNGRHRRRGLGRHRLQDRKRLNQGEHFTVDVAPEKMDQLLDYIQNKKGKVSVACTKTACDSMKAAGVDLGQKSVPAIDKLYKGLLDEAADSTSSVTRAPTSMTLAEQDSLLRKFKTGTNLVKLQFGATAFTGYFYAPALVGTPMNFVIDRMDSHVLEEESQE